MMGYAIYASQGWSKCGIPSAAVPRVAYNEKKGKKRSLCKQYSLLQNLLHELVTLGIQRGQNMVFLKQMYQLHNLDHGTRTSSPPKVREATDVHQTPHATR
jgi:hypothetical protein